MAVAAVALWLGVGLVLMSRAEPDLKKQSRILMVILLPLAALGDFDAQRKFDHWLMPKRLPKRISPAFGRCPDRGEPLAMIREAVLSGPELEPIRAELVAVCAEFGRWRAEPERRRWPTAARGSGFAGALNRVADAIFGEPSRRNAGRPRPRRDGGGGEMLTTARWLTLALAIAAACSWAVVSGLRVADQGPSWAELAAHGAPRRYSDLTLRSDSPPEFVVRNAASLRRADAALRLGTALLVSIHLVILNLRACARITLPIRVGPTAPATSDRPAQPALHVKTKS
ncbi:MAG TPA: hypothetical protein VF590_06010 [Isosphaeraceae bacterium]|jgi:hypothetical protein